MEHNSVVDLSGSQDATFDTWIWVDESAGTNTATIKTTGAGNLVPNCSLCLGGYGAV